VTKAINARINNDLFIFVVFKVKKIAWLKIDKAPGNSRERD